MTISTTGSISTLRGVGPAILAKLAQLEVYSSTDLLFHWPRRWLDLTNPMPISNLKRDQKVVVRGRLSQIELVPRIGRRVARVRAIVTDSTGSIPVVWYNQTYLKRILREGEELILAGVTTWDWQNRQLTLASPNRFKKPEIIPIYPETKGLNSGIIRKLVAQLLPNLKLPDPYSSNHFISLTAAVQTVHQPGSATQLSEAIDRLALDEVLRIQYYVARRRQDWRSRQSFVVEPDLELLKTLIANLPFELTNDQRQAAWEIIQNMSSSMPMNRLLQGDVGTGKTVVALLASVCVIKKGLSVAWLAPTQVLARQLAMRLGAHLEPIGLSPELVISGSKIATGKSRLFVGTHALLNRPGLGKLGLVIVDEQHRFGVNQRTALVNTSKTETPHLLAMTATPIPRSLALSLYGELELSTLKAKPQAQKTVKTVVIGEGKRNQVFRLLKRAVQAGRQAFVVVPRIHAESPTELFPKTRSLAEVLEEYQRQLPEYKIYPYHGNLSQVENEQTIDQFFAGKINILVATTMIETGIDVANAAVIVIESAERFGLSQLHQLRGRVGRGSHTGVCVICSSEGDNERLKKFASTTDGFVLSEYDLAERGPGELAGTSQSGFLKLRFANLGDTLKIEQAKAIVDNWIKEPPTILADWLKIGLRRGDGTNQVTD